MKKNYPSELRRKGRIAALVAGVLIMAAFAVGVCSCKAWRTYTTTATYVQQTDSTGKASATITTKTVEEYQGVKKK